MEIGSIINHRKDPRTFLPSKELDELNSLIGVEIELEEIPLVLDYMNNTYTDMYWWDVVTDHSLRGQFPFEWKLKIPLSGQDIITALQELEEFILIKIKQNNLNLKKVLNERTSVHVHIDVRNLSYIQFIHLLTLSVIFDPVLMHYCCKDFNRWQTGYCVPSYISLNIIDVISNFYTLYEKNYPKDRIEQLILSSDYTIGKYHSFTTNPLTLLGSIEYRQHPGTFYVKDLILWVKILLRMKNYVENTNADQLMKSYPKTFSEFGALHLLRTVFRKEAEILYYPEAGEDLLNNIRLAQDIIYTTEEQMAEYFIISHITTN